MGDTVTTHFSDYSLGFWEVKTIHDNTGRWLVVNRKTGEEHTAYSYKSAFFLCNLFNDQSQWYSYKNVEFIIRSPQDSFHNPPKANWKLYFGDSRNTYFQFYIKNPPNLIQRWLIRKLVGINWESVK